MKKARIILTVVALLAVVGGSLAFKTSRQNLKLYYLTTIDLQPTCLTVISVTTTNQPNADTFVPAGAAGWYTTSLCNTTQTFFARTIAD